MNSPPPHILWATPYTLLDTASGAAISAREMLIRLAKSGYRVTVIGATVFDSHQNAVQRLSALSEDITNKKHKFITVADGLLKHTVLVCQSTNRYEMTAFEEALWFEYCKHIMQTERPNYLFYYGGLNLELLLAREAKDHGLRTIFYLVNGRYVNGARWHRDVDVIVTDSNTTASLYRERAGLDVKAVGMFIDSDVFVASEHSFQRLLFVNPTFDKGAAIVVCLALALEQTRPDIVFEVVESRGQIGPIIEELTAEMGVRRAHLSNLVVTPAQANMKAVYSRARCVIVPSLCYESGSRVLVEAMFNTIPAIATAIGGSAEIIGDAGLLFSVDAKFHQPPYRSIPPLEALRPVLDFIERIYDDTSYFHALQASAKNQAGTMSIEASTRRLLRAIEEPLTSNVTEERA